MNALPASNPGRNQLRSNIRRVILEIERAVHELLDTRWEEPQRRRAVGLAVALTDACRTPDLRHVAGVARAAASLLKLRAGDILHIEDEVREKILDLVDLLKETGAIETESA